ncbi:hypothetical protein [Roseateles chitosanitabidus]|jgi:hypothetical protein|uniref:hypothetical protein n=1 Tax=Roseateles chitosanitabidus TaxID=65048 RepID=UPI0008372C27|nr:hypothetical protein [Roseateles chitosanitabidus]MBO9685137.1 hypothetical protein [Roseateles chitosanitabidus]
MTRPIGPVASVSLLSTSLPSNLPSHDQAALQRHLIQCAKARGRWFGIALMAERVQGLVLPRLATTAALGAITLGLFAHWL